MAPFSKMQQLYATASGILSSYVPLYPEAPHEGALSSPFLLFGSPSTGLNSGCEFVRTTSFFEGVVYTDNSGGSHDSLDHTAFTPMRHYWESECDGVRTRLNTLRSDPSVYEGISFFPNGSYTSFAVSSFDGSTLHHAVSHAGEPDHNQHQEYVHRILELPSWTPGCYPDDTQTHEMGMGVALTNAAWENAASGTVNDWVFYGKLFGRRCYDEGGGVTCTFSLPLSKEEKIQAIIDVLDQAIGFSNSVIKARMNFNFKVKALHIATVPTFLVWNKARSDCSDDIASTCSTCDLGKSIDCDVCFDPVNQLTAQTGFTEWTKSPWCPDTTLGLWLLMDKSCLVGTTIGVSNSALCQGAAIVHASSSSDVLYLTMAQEIGHNLGMEHLSIEEDGIMEAYVPVGGLGAAELRPNPEIDSSTSGIGYNDVWRDSVCTRLSGLQTCSSWKIEQSGGVPSWYPSDNVATVSEADCEVQIAINDEREKAGLSRLPMDRRLHQAAHDYAIYMLHTGFWGHDDAEGRSCRMRAAQSGYESRDTRENIAQGQRSAARVTNAWMNSDGHKRNLLSPGHEHTGVVRVDLPGKSPMWVQLFSRGQEDKNQWVDCGGRDWEGAPTDAPTTAPVAANPTKSPTRAPTDTPTKAPVAQVTDAPITSPPTPSPTLKPTSCIDAGKSVYIVQRDNPTVTTTCSTINGKFQTKLDQDEPGLQQSILLQFFDNYCLPLEKNWIGSGMTCCETCKQAAEALGISVYPPATTPPSIPVPTRKPTGAYNELRSHVVPTNTHAYYRPCPLFDE
ncbi:hypothetical protein TrCOL_g1931 [Triparma columacea]|uniref:SCP domain-containing protein n=1 Tax=Triparma columacea TaxID=722753 RepID=A0A9W7G529_9STRA|nr:hypothetical protein TrCOL_g1931 [Triparma columacea]